MKKYYFYNNFHYGDCLASLHFLNHLTRVNDIECEFICNQQYHWQLQEFISRNPKISLAELPSSSFNSIDLRTHSGPNRAINLWCCPSIQRMWGNDQKTFPAYSKNYPEFLDLGIILFEIWKFVCETNDFVFPFKDVEDIIFDEVKDI